MNVADLQETPSGRPWENDAVRTWAPAPFDLGEYERWAAKHYELCRGRIDQVRLALARRTNPLTEPTAIDPGLRRTPYLDELARPRPWLRT